MRIYLSALEQKDKSYAFDYVRNAFMSYYYIKKYRQWRPVLEAKKKGISIIIDSGAHTFFNEQENHLAIGSGRKKTKTKTLPQVYFDRYLKWVKANYDNFDYYVELDIGEITGQKIVDEWYNVILKEGLGEKCIRVYHPFCCSRKWYSEQLENNPSKFIGLEGMRQGRVRLPYVSLIKEGYDKGVKVHGFGISGADALKRFPFYSTDSTSWEAGFRYGRVPIFEDRKIKMINVNQKSKNIIHFPIKKIHGKNRFLSRSTMGIAGAKAFMELEKFITKLWIKRGVIWED